uniref:Uncharacterized protein n=1 Tax=Molossus molossus TaxID=27622 RepID=A0A7J8DQN0_MOLMO|nr:hypothetical protein HJG59_009265 [Molossus molossus]
MCRLMQPPSPTCPLRPKAISSSGSSEELQRPLADTRNGSNTSRAWIPVIHRFTASSHRPQNSTCHIENGAVQFRKILTNTTNHVQSGNCDFANIASISCLTTSRWVTEMARCEFCSAQAKSNKISVRAYAP